LATATAIPTSLLELAVATKPPGADVVLPNTLRDQMEPNTFRTSSPVANQSSTSGSQWVPSLDRPVNLRIPGWVIRIAISFAIVIAIYLLLSAP
jgi:hypothetical protein